MRLSPLLTAMVLCGALPALAAGEAVPAGGTAPAGSEPSPAPGSAGTGDAAPIVAQVSGADASVVGDDDFLPADEFEESLPATPPPRQAAAPAKRSSGRWGMAPIRWGGTVSAGVRQRTSDSTGDTRDQIYEARLLGSTYLVQPYIALFSGDLSFALLRSQTQSDGSPSANNLSGTSVTGSGTLSVFPQSRFPFQASLGVSDSRTDGSLVSTDTRRTRLSLRQDYRPEIGQWRASGQYERSELEGTSFGRDTVDRLAADFAGSTGEHSFNASGALSSNRTREGRIQDRLMVGRHGYRFDDAVSIDTTATYTGQEAQFDGDDFRISGNTQSAQVFSFGSWNPSESPWRGTANVRYFQTESDFGGGVFESRNLGGGGSLSYQATRNLSLFGTANANWITSGDARELATSQTAGANYSSDPYMFGDYVYTWYGAGNLVNSTSTEAGSQRGVNGSAGHSVQRTWLPTEYSVLTGSVNQSVNSTRSNGLGSVSTTTLMHSASLSLQATPSEVLTGFLSATVSDSRVTGDEVSTFQLVNVQLSGRWRIDTYSELNSNLTWQLARQTSEQRLTTSGSLLDDGSEQSQYSALGGNLGYMHTRVFGVRNLRYTLDFRADTNQTNARQSGNVDAPRERITLDLDQRLRYRIGRLDAELQARVAKVEGRREGLVFFKVSRDFGAY